MCLRVFLGGAGVIAADTEQPHEPRFKVWPLPESAAGVRVHLPGPQLVEVGAHTGCACGFNSAGYAFDGFARTEEVTAHLAAMTDEECAAWRSEQDSRERLAARIADAARAGEVVVYAVWWGDEALPPTEERTVDATYFATFTEPLVERVLYRVRTSA